MKEWLNSRTVRLPFAVALVLVSMLNLIYSLKDVDITYFEFPLLLDKAVSFLCREPFKEILINAIGSFIGGVLLIWIAVGTNGYRSLRAKLLRPTVSLVKGKAPENIFTGLELGSSAQWVHQMLGAPTRMKKGWWGYRFTDALVSLSFSDDDSLVCVSVAVINEDATFHFPSVHFEMPPLGRASLKDLMQSHLQWKYDESTRHSEIFVSGREGPRGAWHYVAFGALSPHIPGPLLTTEFNWDRNTNRLVGSPEDVLINWAAISANSHIDTFPWDLGITV